MRHALYLAFAYLRHHRIKTVVLILTIALIIAMPVVTRLVLDAAERLLATRADATPLVIGAKGSALDVLMNTLYFTDDQPGPLTMAATEDVWDSGYAIAVPVFQQYRAQGQPVVGTTLDYFESRAIELDQGRFFASLGEAVLGSNAAKRLGLGVGDSILSDPVNLFDLTGSYPLKMAISGVLAPQGNADDEAVFADLKTVWVIHGLGHGHDDLLKRPDMVLGEAGNTLIANSGLQLYAEITPENAASFHFHGDPLDYPITGVLAFPPDQRSSTILRGRYVYPELEEQIIVPSDVIGDLLQTVFKIGRILDGVIAAAVLAALLAIGLVFYLSMKLRQAELSTVFKLGGQAMMAFRLVVAELVIVLASSLILAVLAGYGMAAQAERLAGWLLGAV